MKTRIRIEPDMETLCRTTAQAIVSLAQHTVDSGRDFYIALTGGNTPRRLYQLLAKAPLAQQMPWEHTHIFFSDERAVSADHADSNYRMAKEALLVHVPLPKAHIHRIVGEHPIPKIAAAEYDQTIFRFVPRDASGQTQFDLILLGLGPDGHIASLFPDTDALQVTDKRVTAVWVQKLDCWRISVTFPVINHARQIWMFVSGEPKADIIAEVLNRAPSVPGYPVEMIQPEGELIWCLDQAAASKLKSKS
ncbi:MAG: 6-phosphogluconolactonase [Gammaproteobacteria bacterium]|nr:6-phosphogluconolactonase [Gammaproteobacteria bacterium]